MKSAWLVTPLVLAILIGTSSARADWDSLKPNGDDSRKGYPILPVINIAAGIDPGKKSNVYGNFLLGVAHYPIGGQWSPFYSVAVEMDLRSLRDNAGNTRTIPTFGPQIRGGVSYFDTQIKFLSLFNAYGLLGYRAPSAFEGHVFRFGVGVSSPGPGLMLLTKGLPIPWMVEGAFDVTELGIRPSVRFGFSY